MTGAARWRRSMTARARMARAATDPVRTPARGAGRTLAPVAGPVAGPMAIPVRDPVCVPMRASRTALPAWHAATGAVASRPAREVVPDL